MPDGAIPRMRWNLAIRVCRRNDVPTAQTSSAQGTSPGFIRLPASIHFPRAPKGRSSTPRPFSVGPCAVSRGVLSGLCFPACEVFSFDPRAVALAEEERALGTWSVFSTPHSGDASVLCVLGVSVVGLHGYG
jgi:hypothetical protein